MPIDPSIALNVRPVQLANPLEQFGQLQQARAAMSQNRLADLVFGEKQRELDESAQVNRLWKGAVSADGKTDRNKLLGDLAANGLGSRITSVQKGFQDLDAGQAKIAKEQAETQVKQIESLSKANGMVGSAAGAILQNPTYENAVQVVNSLRQQFGPELSKQYGLDGLQIPQDPAQIKTWANNHYLQSIDSEKQLADARTAFEGQANRQNQKEIGAAHDATARRGQDLTNQRAREQLAQGKVPSGYRQNADGSLVAIRGGPADPEANGSVKLTEQQGKATGFAARMQDADKILSAYENEVSPAAVSAVGGITPSWLPGGGIVDALTNNAVGRMQPKAQLYQQAQENWVTANLRLESGAVIGDVEKANEVRKWFPQPGDTPERIAQKAAARKVAEQSMLVQAGPGGKQVPGIVAVGATPPAATKSTAGAGRPAAKPSLSDIFGN